mmetsp:Transcript_2858/g.5343  ORF Transcript_2858/g.5343 Transcript_2858/m.5343 type:complete len:321 (+) Transcript_2858:445-1407(+)
MLDLLQSNNRFLTQCNLARLHLFRSQFLSPFNMLLIVVKHDISPFEKVASPQSQRRIKIDFCRLPTHLMKVLHFGMKLFVQTPLFILNLFTQQLFWLLLRVATLAIAIATACNILHNRIDIDTLRQLFILNDKHLTQALSDLLRIEGVDLFEQRMILRIEYKLVILVRVILVLHHFVADKNARLVQVVAVLRSLFKCSIKVNVEPIVWYNVALLKLVLDVLLLALVDVGNAESRRFPFIVLRVAFEMLVHSQLRRINLLHVLVLAVVLASIPRDRLFSDRRHRFLAAFEQQRCEFFVLRVKISVTVAQHTFHAVIITALG